MEGLTAKVFRTYNASRTLEEQLNLLTKGEQSHLFLLGTSWSIELVSAKCFGCSHYLNIFR